MSRYVVSVEDFVGLLFDVQESDRDAVLVITGDTGEGKSVLLWRILVALAFKRGMFFDPVDQLVYDRSEFKDAIDDLPVYSGIGADEAVGIFYSRDYHDDQQIALLKKLDRIRYRKLVLGLAIPSLFHIDKHIRDARVRYWIYIESRKGSGDSGYAHAYVFEKEKNPFNSDPWNLNFNRRLWTKGQIDRSKNYVGEIIYKDISAAEYTLYNKVKDIKRKIAESVEWRNALVRRRRHGKTGEEIDSRLKG